MSHEQGERTFRRKAGLFPSPAVRTEPGLAARPSAGRRAHERLRVEAVVGLGFAALGGGTHIVLVLAEVDFLVRVGEDLDVLIELCDRILVIGGGEIAAVVDGRTASKEEIGLLMTKSKSSSQGINDVEKGEKADE